MLHFRYFYNGTQDEPLDGGTPLNSLLTGNIHTQIYMQNPIG